MFIRFSHDVLLCINDSHSYFQLDWKRLNQLLAYIHFGIGLGSELVDITNYNCKMHHTGPYIQEGCLNSLDWTTGRLT